MTARPFAILQGLALATVLLQVFRIAIAATIGDWSHFGDILTITCWAMSVVIIGFWRDR